MVDVGMEELCRQVRKFVQTSAGNDIGMPIRSKRRLRTVSDRKPLLVVFDLA